MVNSNSKRDFSYCSACLSNDNDRTLSKLYDNSDMFFDICGLTSELKPEDTFLCWECIAILKKIRIFKAKVSQAQEILRSFNKNIQITKSLSSLKLTEETNCIYFKYDELIIDVKEENSISNPASDTEIPLCNIEYNKDNESKTGHEISCIIKEEFPNDDDSNTKRKEILQHIESKRKIKKHKYSKHNRNVKGPSKYHNINKIFKCDYCGKDYKSKNVLEKHIRNHSTTHLCNVCNKIFKTKATLRKHIDIKHVTIKTEDAYCVQCDIQFNNVKVYRRHVKTSIKHIKERNGQISTAKIPCPECGNIYSRKAYMMNHYNYVHRNASKYYCIQCDKKFLNRTKYMDHTRYYHEGKKKEKNKICNICGRGFAVKRTLINHIRTHSGERPYQCPHCSNRFVQKHAMLTHVKHVHTKRDVIKQVDKCNKSLMWKIE